MLQMQMLRGPDDCELRRQVVLKPPLLRDLRCPALSFVTAFAQLPYGCPERQSRLVESDVAAAEPLHDGGGVDADVFALCVYDSDPSPRTHTFPRTY